MANFFAKLLNEIFINLHNDYKDNYDYYRFGILPVSKKKSTLKYALKNKITALLQGALAKRNFVRLNPGNTEKYIHQTKKLEPWFNLLGIFYNLLNDKASKDILVKLVAYRVLGHTKIKLPLNTAAYWQGIHEIENIADNKDVVHVNFFNWDLAKIDLSKFNIPIQLYMTPVNAHRDFVLKQYEYKNEGVLVNIEKGDYIIDAGGCWGDTALYFANETGEHGKVFSYEFIPSNIEIFKKNTALNPELEKRIILINKPVWETSGMNMYYLDNGPGSKVFTDETEVHDGAVQSLSIDDLVMQNNISKIDFIKMDIEGAEPYALKGAVQTIKKFKPKLAIAIYHSLDDFTNIPMYIDSLNCGYHFYLGHFTIHTEETILFAISENQ